jgi:hypothetical protein
MARVLGGVLVLCLCLAWPAPTTAQGLLQRARDATHHGPGSPPRPPAPASNSSSKTDTGAGVGGNTAEGLEGALLGVGVLVSMPFVLPAALAGDTYDSWASFPNAPYAPGSSGYLSRDAFISEAVHPGDPMYLKPWGAWLAVEEGNDLRGLNRVGLSAAVDTAWRLGLRTDWDLFTENGGGRTDHSVQGDVSLTFRFVQTEALQMHAGLGARLLADPSDTRGGFNFTYGLDAFPVQPLTVSASCDLGSLDAAFVVRARASVGAVWRNFEVYGGYDFLRIGSVNLQGPTAGLRVWF